MPFLLRSKSRLLVIRDGTTADSPTYEVGPKAFVPFEHLPRGLSEAGDSDVEVKHVDKVPPDVKRPESLQAIKARKEGESAAAIAKKRAEKLAATAKAAATEANLAEAEAQKLAELEAEQKRAELKAQEPPPPPSEDELDVKGGKAKLAKTVKEK